MASALREIRQAANLTLSEVGDSVGVTASAVSLWELGLREPMDGETFRRLAEYCVLEAEKRANTARRIAKGQRLL